MLDTPTTAFYHRPNQNVKSLFSSIPSVPALPALVNISLGSYFQLSSQQETKLSSSSLVETSSTSSNDLVNSAPTAPQQPPHTNRRARRIPQKQQNSVSATIAATAPRVVAPNNNMGNVNSSTAQSSKVPSSNIATSSSSPSSSPSPSHHHHHHHHHHHRRRKHLNKINRKKVDEAITLSAFAVEEDNQGNHDVAMEFYLNAIENMLDACPIHGNQSRKDALKNKLRDFMDREGLTDDFMESTNASSVAKAIEREESKLNHNNSRGPGISDQIIKAAITSAVAFKQSPIPDAISATVNYTMKKFQKIDEAYGLQNKAWEISRSGINMALEIDQQYNVHEKVGNAFFLGIKAAMKAGIAYKDAPSYREIRKMHTDFNNAGTSNNIKEESS